MIGDITTANEIYIVTGYTDMRNGIDGLAQIVEGNLRKDVYNKAVYLFCGQEIHNMEKALDSARTR